MPRVVVFLADGFEEVEAVTPVDYLRRAGIDVLTVGVGTGTPVGARGIRIVADVQIESLQEIPDGVVLPGGMPGSSNLAASGKVAEITRNVMKNGGLVGSICAAPALALGSFGLLKNRRFTCYPGMEKEVPADQGTFIPDRVVVDRNLITSRGAGTAGEFSIAMIRYLSGEEEAEKIMRGVLL
jgi:4-methyl-5(b-hydroxyethyl)-thiazole monophosphate biosynthesis